MEGLLYMLLAGLGGILFIVMVGLTDEYNQLPNGNENPPEINDEDAGEGFIK